MIPTPDTDHVPFERVYEPSEDSYLILDALSSEIETEFLHSQFASSTAILKEAHSGPPLLAVEIGTGSGVVLAFITARAKTILGTQDVMTIGVDINQHACNASIQTVRKACKTSSSHERATFLDQVQGDLTVCLRGRAVDVLVFNPPYVPTEDVPSTQTKEGVLSRAEKYEQDSQLLALSYAGGIDGMEVTNRFLAQLPSVLSDVGVAYLLLCAQNKPEEVKKRIKQWEPKWSVETIKSSGKVGGWEKLQILRIWRTKHPS